MTHDRTDTLTELHSKPTHEEPKPMMTPSVGRIVHYQHQHENTNQPLAAIITAVNQDGTVNLVVFNESYTFFRQTIQYDDNRAPNTWHQPPYVPQR